eukprot:12743243-Alexandrium_andersonii.AAC.1
MWPSPPVGQRVVSPPTLATTAELGLRVRYGKPARATARATAGRRVRKYDWRSRPSAMPPQRTPR